MLKIRTKVFKIKKGETFSTLMKRVNSFISSKANEGYTAQYVFLNRSEEAISKFYDEHKDGGRIVWNNN